MKILILYSTIYGHNLEMSKFIQQRFFPQADYLTITEFNPIMLKDYDLLIICPCTYGNGELWPADESLASFLKKSHLAHLKFTVIGAGDRNFGQGSFANAVDIFSYLLKRTGAQEVHAPLKYDFDDLLTVQEQLSQLWENGLIKEYLQ